MNVCGATPRAGSQHRNKLGYPQLKGLFNTLTQTLSFKGEGFFEQGITRLRSLSFEGEDEGRSPTSP